MTLPVTIVCHSGRKRKSDALWIAMLPAQSCVACSTVRCDYWRRTPIGSNSVKKFMLGLTLACTISGGHASAKNAFDYVKCDADIPSLMIGKHLPEGTVVDLETKYKSIELKDTGGEEVTDTLGSTSWMICGSEYMVLDRHNAVRDVIEIPQHSRRAPEFSGDVCQLNGKPTSGPVVAILDNSSANPTDTSHYGPGDRTLLPATSAWLIDEKEEKFVKLSTSGLNCPRSGIITLDGGA